LDQIIATMTLDTIVAFNTIHRFAISLVALLTDINDRDVA
jgi:hypothetical protein